MLTLLMHSLVASGILAFCLWRILRLITAQNSPLAVIRGPDKEHWLTGTLLSLLSRTAQTALIRKLP